MECPVSKSIFYYIKPNTMHLRNSGNNFVYSQYCSSAGNMNLGRKSFVFKNLSSPKTMPELLENVVLRVQHSTKCQHLP